ncbi:MAG: MFS transporter [Alphaproteobacteria bacterium]|nr:MFS transporter [Alphaproteobacteria bacterium]
MSDNASAAHTGLLTHPMTPAWVLALAVCLTQFDVTAAAVALPVIRAELDFSLAATAWVMDAYSLAFAGTLFAAGALADRFGRRRLLLAGNGIFALASLLCGLAWDGPSLWAARALQGAGAACFITGGLAAVSLAYPVSLPADRARAYGIIGVTGGAAMALGPTLGGLIAAHVGWRWIFLVNLPICAVSEYAVRRVIGETRDEIGRPLDLLGVALLTLAIALPVQALLQEGTDKLWRWSGVALGLACAVLLVLQQRRRAQPMLELALFTRRAPLGIIILLFSLSIGYWAVLVYLPLWLLATYALDTQQAGLAMLAATLPMLVLPPLGVRLTQRHGWRANFTGGMLLLSFGTVGLAAVAVLKADLFWALAAMMIAASGAGLSNSQVSGALVAQAPADRAGMASALATVLRQGGYALGIGLLGAISVVAGYGSGFAAAALAALLGAVAAALCLPRQI